MQRYKLLIKQQIKYGINCVKLKKIFLKFFSFAKFEYLHQTLRASCYLPPHLYVFCISRTFAPSFLFLWFIGIFQMKNISFKRSFHKNMWFLAIFYKNTTFQFNPPNKHLSFADYYILLFSFCQLYKNVYLW